MQQVLGESKFIKDQFDNDLLDLRKKQNQQISTYQGSLIHTKSKQDVIKSQYALKIASRMSIKAKFTGIKDQLKYAV